MSKYKLSVLLLTGIEFKYIPPEIEMPMYLASLGHNLVAIFQDKKVSYYNHPSFMNCKIITVPYKKIFHIFDYINLIKNIQEKYRFNIVFASRSLLNLLACMFLRLKGVRTIFIVENPIEQGWVTQRFKTRSKIRKHFIDVANMIRRHFFLIMLKKVDLIITISHGIRQDLLQHGISRRIVVIPEGVNVSRFINITPEEVEPIIERYNNDASILVVYVGTLDKLRNLGILVKAFSIVVSKREKVKLMLVGDGDDVPFLKRLVDKLGISSKVIFTGRVNSREIPKIIAASDICISLIPPFTFYKASCPIKIHECMAGGKPVIANGEIPEQLYVIGESRGGILTIYDYHAIAQAMVLLIDDSKKRRELGENGRRWIIHNRSYDILVRHIEKICFELLRGTR